MQKGPIESSERAESEWKSILEPISGCQAQDG